MKEPDNELISFAIYLTGHNEETILQMYSDWKQSPSKPILTIIDHTENNWQELEKHWIKIYKNAGCRLLNHTEGGEGHSGRSLSKEHRDKISKSSKKTNAKLSEEDVKNICNLIVSKKCYREIKELFPNLTEGCFYSIKCGYNWKNITKEILIKTLQV